ncbi:hypothetical protein Hanom_Chr09g00775591 [Helianthus anomalus]
MFSALSSFVDKRYIESFYYFVNENTVECLLLPTDFVKNTIGVSKRKGAMKVYINAWNWFDVIIEKDRISKSYFFGNKWKKVVGFVGFNEKCVVAIKYLFYYNFHWTLFDVNRCEVLVPKVAMKNTAGVVDKPASQTSNATPRVVELPDNQPTFDDESDSLDEDSDYHDLGDGIFVFDVSVDDASDDEDSGGSSDDAKDDPDYHPVQFVWKFDCCFVSYVIYSFYASVRHVYAELLRCRVLTCH